MLLTPVQARKLFEYCVQEKFAVLAVNADSPAALCDCLTAARNLGAPIMVETSQWQLEGISFGAGDPGRGLAMYFAHLSLLASSEEFAGVPVALHTDHIRGPRTREILKQAVKGYPFAYGVSAAAAGQSVRLSPSSISLDASKLTPEQNIELMCSLIETSRACGRPVTVTGTARKATRTSARRRSKPTRSWCGASPGDPWGSCSTDPPGCRRSRSARRWPTG